MERLTTDTPNGNFEIMLNFVYGKDGWAYIRHDGAHEDVMLTDWAKKQCLTRGCNDAEEDGPEDIDQRLCDCMMEGPTCPIAMAYCFASQAVHLRSRLKMYEDAMPLDRAQGLARAEKDGRLVVLPDRLKMLEYCPMRHPDNGNCVVAGGFCKPDTEICKALHAAYVEGLFNAHEEAEAALKKREAEDNEAD